MALWISVLVAIFGTLIFHSGKQERFVRKQKVMIHPPQQMSHMTLGYGDFVADAMWIRLIQDYDLCEASNQEVFGSAVGKRCSEGWIFRMVDAITDLSPRFRMPYATGGTMLTVIVEDFKGAEKVFAKGEKQFPDDYVFPYRAAYNYMYGLDRPVDASAALLRASKLEGAPAWLPLLAARKAKEGKDPELGVRILEELIGEKPEWKDNPRVLALRDELMRLKNLKQPTDRAPTGD